MLRQLTIRNYVLVDALDIQFEPGLTTITGESGAGKSILLGALGLLLGDRARADVVGPGAGKADISAEFDVSTTPAAVDLLRDAELQDGEPGHCLIRRVVSSQGRSRAFVNGIPVTLQYLQQLARHVVDVYGQNEHRQLADPGVQLTLLDAYAGAAAQAARVGALYREWQRSRRRIEELEASVAAQQDREALLTYQLNELDELGLQAGELATLEAEQRRLAQATQLIETTGAALTALDATSELRQAAAQIDAIDDEHADLAAARDAFTSALELIDDAARDLRHYREQIVVDPEALDAADARLERVHDLARKHRVQPETLHVHTEGLREELASFAGDSGDLSELKERVQAEEDAFRSAAADLSATRRKHAKRFAKAVSNVMRSLGITDGALTVELTATESERGLDQAEFLVQTSRKFEPAPLRRVASGGEQTRIALSIQIVAADTSALPCLVLDEADVGVGGTTADTVGRILRDLAAHTQIICVTHAPQVAALGHHHLRVTKSRDATRIEALEDQPRIDELARMLAGASVTTESRDYASTLLADADR